MLQHRGILASGTFSTRTGTTPPARRRRPLLRGIPESLEIRLREQCDHPVERSSASLIASHEILARCPVPRIQLDGVTGLYQLPGHPLRPCPVPAVLAGLEDESLNFSLEDISEIVAELLAATTFRQAEGGAGSVRSGGRSHWNQHCLLHALREFEHFLQRVPLLPDLPGWRTATLTAWTGCRSWGGSRTSMSNTGRARRHHPRVPAFPSGTQHGRIIDIHST